MDAEKLVCIEGLGKKLTSREDVADIVYQIDECDGLTSLQLSGNSFGVEATTAIGECLAHKPNFSRALLSDMFVSRLKSEIPPSLIALGDGIMKAKSCLVELDLSDNALGPTGVEHIIPLLKSPSFYSIKVLKFNNNGLGSKGGVILAKSLLECHSEAQKAGQKLALEVFVAGRNRLENVGAIALSELFETIESLVSVSMPQNGIDAEGICALSCSFSHNRNLEVIDLNDNTFTEVGSVAMAEVLPNLQKLRVINFGDCLVRPGGALAIAAAIKDGHKQLQELNLGFCELDQSAGLAIAEALANKKELERIDMNGNCFFEEGIELLRESLEAKGHLDSLGTLSDDEGLLENDDDSEEERFLENGEDDDSEEEEEATEAEAVLEKREDEDDNDKFCNKEEEDNEENSGIMPMKESGVERKEESQQRLVTLSDYLCNPTGENLLLLGHNQTQLLDSLVRSPPSDEKNEGRLEDDLAWISATASMFTKVTRDYGKHMGKETGVQSAIDSTVDAILRPPCMAGLVSELINEILIHIGLLKSEDKNFVPVKEIDGPILALMHVVRQDYLPRMSLDILIAFFTKSNPLLSSIQAITYQVLQVFHLS